MRAFRPTTAAGAVLAVAALALSAAPASADTRPNRAPTASADQPNKGPAPAPTGYCSFVAGSATVRVHVTRTSISVVHVVAYATKAVNFQPSSYVAYPKLYLPKAYGTRYDEYHGGITSPDHAYLRATRGGVGGSCKAPIPERVATSGKTSGTVG